MEKHRADKNLDEAVKELEAAIQNMRRKLRTVALASGKVTLVLSQEE